MTQDSALINEIQRSVAALGVDDTIETLRKGRDRRLGENYMMYVLKEVAQAVQVNLTEVTTGGIKSDKRKVALSLSIYFMNTIFEYNLPYIADIMPFKISRRYVHEYRKVIKEAKLQNPKSDIDKIISLHYKPLEEKVYSYKNLISNEKQIHKN